MSILQLKRVSLKFVTVLAFHQLDADFIEYAKENDLRDGSTCLLALI